MKFFERLAKHFTNNMIDDNTVNEYVEMKQEEERQKAAEKAAKIERWLQQRKVASFFREQYVNCNCHELANELRDIAGFNLDRHQLAGYAVQNCMSFYGDRNSIDNQLTEVSVLQQFYTSKNCMNDESLDSKGPSL